MGAELGDADLGTELLGKKRAYQAPAGCVGRGSGEQTDRQTGGRKKQSRKNLFLAAPGSFVTGGPAPASICASFNL